MTGVLFRLTHLEHGRPLGWALLCPGARYCSLALLHTERLVRRHAPVHEWKQIEFEVSAGINQGPLPKDSALGRLISDSAGDFLVVQYVTMPTFTESAAELPAALDAYLLHQRGAVA